MGNTAHTISEQIEKLRSRGMLFDKTEEKAKEQLFDIGYYRLGFYWYYFEKENKKRRKHIFEENTKFSDIIKLYYLDTDLKHLLLKMISRIEINFRTKVVYYVSNHYKEKPSWYADKEVMNKSFIDELPDFYNEKFKYNNKPLKKYIGNKKYAPAWKVLEFFTFGSILQVYNNLKDKQLQQKIANEYGIKSIKTCSNFFNTIRFIRNICAHSGTLYDSSIPFEIQKTSLVNFNNNNRHSLDSSIKVILYILEKISPKRKKEYQQKIRKLLEKQKNNAKIKKIIEEKIGFIF